MAADLWQLVNGWSLVDWSLNVGGDEPAPSPSGGTPRFSYQRVPRDFFDRRTDDDDDALALILALI